MPIKTRFIAIGGYVLAAVVAAGMYFGNNIQLQKLDHKIGSTIPSSNTNPVLGDYIANNPGYLLDTRGDIQEFPSVQEGEQALLSYVQFQVTDDPNWSLIDFSNQYVLNDSALSYSAVQYAADLANTLHFTPFTKISAIPTQDIVNAITNINSSSKLSLQSLPLSGF